MRQTKTENRGDSMKNFAELIQKLDSTNKTNKKVAYLSEYFQDASSKNKLWTIALLSHRRPPRPVNSTMIRDIARELSGVPEWLFEESYHIVGDLAETIALLVDKTSEESLKPMYEYLEDLIHLKGQTEVEKKLYLQSHWKRMNYYERFVFTKLLTGGFRIGVSQKLMTRALSKAEDIDEDILAFRLMGDWKPSNTSYEKLILQPEEGENNSRPYPFYLCHSLADRLADSEESPIDKLNEWLAEYKWDGIRAQLIKRGETVSLWTRGEELVTDRYPEVIEGLSEYPDDFVLDGELLVFKEGKLGSFQDMQKRIGRKNITANLLKNYPVILRGFDLLEWAGEDWREKSLAVRRDKLEHLISQLGHAKIDLSERIKVTSWGELEIIRKNARKLDSEGLMLKRLSSTYGVGRKKGDWWKWKLDPQTVDAVLTYAMRGHGRRSNLFTDYTFALWKKGPKDGSKELVTFAKAYSGLSDSEFAQVDSFIKKNTLERFGPVRSVVPELVFEIAFEGIALSKRHKSGYSVRFPRIKRWRRDKKPDQANWINDLQDLQ